MEVQSVHVSLHISDHLPIADQNAFRTAIVPWTRLVKENVVNQFAPTMVLAPPPLCVRHTLIVQFALVPQTIMGTHSADV